MNLDTKRIGMYIQARRKLAGLTQFQLGDRLNVTAQSVSNWERGLLLPDTATLPDLAQILTTTVDAILAGGDCPRGFHRRTTVSQIREAISSIDRLREILGSQHAFYRTMVDALDEKMNSSIEMAFHSEGAMDAYICEALMLCLEQGDYVDRDDVRTNITNARAAAAVLTRLDAAHMK